MQRVEIFIVALLGGCLYTSGDPGPSTGPIGTQYGCGAILRCTDRDPIPADFQRCEADRDEAIASVDEACDVHAESIGCPEWTCDVTCSNRGVCLLGAQ